LTARAQSEETGAAWSAIVRAGKSRSVPDAFGAQTGSARGTAQPHWSRCLRASSGGVTTRSATARQWHGPSTLGSVGGPPALARDFGIASGGHRRVNGDTVRNST
jgi:hypothetical protein